MISDPQDELAAALTAPAGRTRRRRVRRVVLTLGLSFVLALALVLGAALVLPAGAGGVNHLIVPVIVFPLVWTGFFLIGWLFRSGEPARRRLYVLHSWTGLLLGLLGLVVFFTGAIAVFASEIGAWGRRARTYPALAEVERPRLTELIRRLGATVDPALREESSFFQSEGGPLTLFVHRHDTDAKGKLIERGVRFDVDPATHDVVLRREGTRDDVFEPTPEEILSSFFIRLHVQLLIPEPVGLYVTGVVGIALLLLVASGVVVHRRFFAEAFQRRRRVTRRLLFRDLHTVTGVWTLPYALVVAFTGSYFSFGDGLLFPGVAQVAFGGDEKKLMEALVGDGGEGSVHSSSQVADLDTVLADARRRVPGPLGFGSLQNEGKQNARISIWVNQTQNRLTPSQLEYDGVTGAFIREKPSLGTAPSVGATLASIMAPLHFGNFAGVLSQSLWAFLGIGCCLLVCTGLAVWSERRMARAEKQRAADMMRRVLAGAAAGMPAAALGAVIGWAGALRSGLDAWVCMGVTSGVVLALSLVLALRLSSIRLAIRSQLIGGGVLALAAPLAATWATGLWSIESPPRIAAAACTVDALFGALGVGLLAAAFAIRKPDIGSVPAAALPAPAVIPLERI